LRAALAEHGEHPAEERSDDRARIRQQAFLHRQINFFTKGIM
jgi:hypothetical protein